VNRRQINKILHKARESFVPLSNSVFSCALAFGLVQAFSFPNLSFATEAETIEIYENYGTPYTLDAPPPDRFPIILTIPHRFLFRSGGMVPARDWGANLLTYYPSFTSLSDPENSKFGANCIGICNGQVLISIRNRAHSINAASRDMGDFIARAQVNSLKTPVHPPPNARVRDLDPSEPFDEAFERALLNPTDEKVAQIDRIYMRKARDQGHYDLVATCTVNSSRSTCTLHFSLACNPAIYISVNGIDGSYLNRSEDIREKADHFVSSMVQRPSCSS
jgi:hypothetical protein